MPYLAPGSGWIIGVLLALGYEVEAVHKLYDAEPEPR